MSINSAIKTDLAIEAKELASAQQGEVAGVESEETQVHGFTVNRLKIVNEEGERNMNKPRGNYVTIELPRDYRYNFELFKNAVSVIGFEISRILNLKPDDSVLVVGLGNSAITADALGPLAIRSTLITRHVKEQNIEGGDFDHFRPVAGLVPGVMGQTGVETVEIIKGLVSRINPSVLIVIDALSARRLSRLATTVQISDTGINPGSGVGNSRSEISEKSIGIPVISVGIPMVVNAATMTADVIELISEEIKKQAQDNKGIFTFLETLNRDELYTLSIDSLKPYDLNLFVTPKDIDDIVASGARLLGYSINTALQKDMTIDEMFQILS